MNNEQSVAQRVEAPDNVYERAIDAIEQLIACHEEPTCPAISVGHDVVAMLRAALATTPSEHHVIAAFLERSGQYVTNDATRDACIAAAITADRMERAADAVPVAQPTSAGDAEGALRKVLAVVRRYLPPDGIGNFDALCQIIAIVDPWPLDSNPDAPQPATAAAGEQLGQPTKDNHARHAGEGEKHDE